MPDCNPLKLTQLKSDFFLHELCTTAEQKEDHSDYDSWYKKKLKAQFVLCIWEAIIPGLGKRLTVGGIFSNGAAAAKPTELMTSTTAQTHLFAFL